MMMMMMMIMLLMSMSMSMMMMFIGIIDEYEYLVSRMAFMTIFLRTAFCSMDFRTDIEINLLEPLLLF